MKGVKSSYSRLVLTLYTSFNWELSELKRFLTTGIASLPSPGVQCPALTTPGQGTMHCRHHLGTFGFNTTCYFGCNAGFTLIGDSILSCRPSGQWTAVTPTCRGKVKRRRQFWCCLPASTQASHCACMLKSHPTTTTTSKCHLPYEIHTNPN